MGYTCLVFCSFSVSFFILAIINVFIPISNFKMTILSVVSFLLSTQQLLEVQEEADAKFSELGERISQRKCRIASMNGIPDQPISPSKNENGLRIVSQWVFVAAMVILIVGLVLDFDFSNSIIANTTTICSFAFIFFTMAFKERFLTKLDSINRELYEMDQQIIADQHQIISMLEKM